MTEPTAARIRPARRMASIPFSPIRQVFEEVGRLQAQGRDIVNLAIGRPDFDTPEIVKERAAEALRAGKVHYTSNYGIPELRRAVAAFESKRLGIDLGDEQVLIAVGANEAIFLVMMAYADPGDEVLIPSPSWYHYDYCATLAGADVVHYPLREERGFVPDPLDVESRLTDRTRVLVINTPHNPTGTVVPSRVIREIVALARAHGVLVLSDEVYSQLVYAGYEHVSPLVAEEQDQGARAEVILVSGLSKAWSMTGWRLGYAIASREVLSNLVKVHQYTVTCATSFCQEGAVAAFTPAGLAEVARMREAFQERRDLVVGAIRQISGWQAVEPGGAFYVFINVARRASGRSRDPGGEIAGRLLHEAGVAVVPGSAFAAEAAEYIRLSYASSRDSLEEAFRRMRRLY